MLLDLLAALAGGLGLMVAVFLVGRVLRLKPARWVYPASIGLGMLAMTVYLEQSWAGRMMAQLPERIVVTDLRERSVWWQPWTYIAPRTDGFSVFDPAATRRNAGAPSLRLVEMLHLDRASPTLKSYVFLDCEVSRMAPVGDATEFAADGAPSGLDWAEMAPGAAIAKACL